MPTPAQKQPDQVKGFDGRRIPWPQEQSTSSASASASSEVESLRDMVKKLASGQPLSAEEMRQLEDSPRRQLGNQQRALNQQRKLLNKERNLEDKIRQNDSDFAHWFDSQKVLMKSEKERYNSEQQKLKKDLAALRQPSPEPASDEEEMMPADEMLKEQHLEQRILQAERMAYDSQQAFLSIQGQLQMMMTYMAPQTLPEGPVPLTPQHGSMQPLQPTAWTQDHGESPQAWCEPTAPKNTSASTRQQESSGQDDPQEIPGENRREERQGQEPCRRSRQACGAWQNGHQRGGRRGYRIALASRTSPWIIDGPPASSCTRPPDKTLADLANTACDKGKFPATQAAPGHETRADVSWAKGSRLCENGVFDNPGHQVTTKTMSLEEDRIALLQRVLDQQPPPNIFTGFQNQFHEMPEDDDRVRVTGQYSDPLPHDGDLTAWRPTLQTQRHLGHPESTHIHLEMLGADTRDDFVHEAIITAWPILETTPWILSLVHDSWIECEGMDRSTDHAVIADDFQFPQTTTWRSGLIAVEQTYPGTYETNYEIGTFTTRVPLYYNDLLTQTELTWDRHQIHVTINGEELRAEHNGRFFAHGFFLHIRLRPTPSLCSTPSSTSLVEELLNSPHAPRLENGESEAASDDPEANPEPNSAHHEGYDEMTRLMPRTSSTERPPTPVEIPESILSSDSLRQFDVESQSAALPMFHPAQLAVADSPQPIRISLADALDQPCTCNAKIDPLQPQGSDVSGPRSPKNSDVFRLKRRISLNLLLPEGQATADIQPHTSAAAPNIIAIPDDQIFFKLTIPWHFELFDAIPDHITLHDATSDWLKTRPAIGEPCGQVLHYYTDGSAHPDQATAGWAWAAFVGHSKDDPIEDLQLLGWLAGPVITEKDHKHYTGALKANSLNGEAAAMFWALVHALSNASWCHTIVLHFDAINVGYVMNGVFKTNPDHPALEALRMMMQVVEHLYKPEHVHSFHVKGHSSHPLNELVNTLAAHASYDCSWTRQPDEIDFTDLFKQDWLALKWLWMHPRRLHHAHALPQIQGQQMTFPGRAHLDATDPHIDWTFGYGQHNNRPSPCFCPDLHLMSYNVRSLKHDSQDLASAPEGRMSYLEQQFLNLEIQIVGLQETRTPASDVITSANYVRYRSAALRGHGGTELWLHRHLPLGYVQGRPARLLLAQAVVLHADPELLAVRIPCAGTMDFILVTGHAPHKGHPEAVKESWWAQLAALLQPYTGHSWILLMLDANAALGSITTHGISDHAAADEDFNGEQLRALADALQLWLPSTFDGIHSGPNVTWISPASKVPQGLRNDYIILPIEWTMHAVSSSTIPDIDATQASLDHFAVMASVTSSVHPTSTPPIGPKRPGGPKVDWTLVRKCRNHDVWDKIFSELPQPYWNQDIHQHWQICHTALLERLAHEFPLRKSKPKKPYISNDTWTLRNQRQSLRRTASLHAHLCPQIQTLSAFQALRHGLSLRDAFLRGALWLLRCLAAHQSNGRQLKDTQLELRRALRHQKLDYLKMIADEASTAPRNQLYAKLKAAGFCAARRRITRPLPILHDVDGKPLTNLPALKERWRTHFAQIECGRAVQPEELLQLCILTDIEKYQTPDIDFLQHIPTLHTFEQALLKCKGGKAAGPDLIPPELCHYAARWLAHYVAPLIFKCQVYGSEPIQWKGGILHSVWKRKGAMTSPDAYRGILVSSHLAKCFHNSFRKQALDWHIQTADEMQFGGIPHKSVAMATHVLKTFNSLTQQRKLSSSIIFLDIKAAYYRLLRCLAIGPTCTRPELTHLFKTMGLPEELLHELIRNAYDTSALEATGCPDWLRQFAATFHRHTWYHLHQDAALTETLRGTRPGDGWADMLFSLTVGRLLRDLESRFQEEGIQCGLSWNGLKTTAAAPGHEVETHGFAIVWADDIAMMLQHHSPEELVRQTEYVAAVVIETFGSFGLLLNYEDGKTECLMTLRGPGSRDLRRKLFGVPTPSLTLHTTGFGPIALRLIEKYRHLGNIVHASGHLIHELRIRVGAANTAFAQHRRAVYHNRALALDRRRQLFQACVLSVLYWNCGTWAPLRPPEARYFYGAVLRLVKRFLLADYDIEVLNAWTAHRVYATAGLHQPEVALRLGRLGYYGTIVQHGPDALWALLASEERWLGRLAQDLTWMSYNCQSRVFRPFFDTDDGPDYWHALICDQPRVWKGLLKKAKLHSLLQAQIASEADTFDRNIATILQSHHASLAPMPTPDLEAPLPYVCIPCKRSFATKAAWGVHTFKMHHRKAPARYLADQARCDHCMKTYHNAYRLYLHLRYSQDCFSALRQRGVHHDPLPGRGSRIWQQESQFTLCPFLHGSGPAPEAPPDQISQLMLTPHEMDLLEDLMALELLDSYDYAQPDLPEQFWDSIRAVLCRHPVSFEDMTQALATWSNLLMAPFRPRGRLIPIHVASWCQAIRLAEARLSLTWLCPDLIPRHRPLAQHYCGRQQLADIPRINLEHAPRPGYGPCARQPIFIHFFSGRRRPGDIQEALEKLNWDHCWPPVIISLDIVLDATHGDLMKPSVRLFWLRLIKEGYVDGALMGPPCESWSISREKWREDHCGPQPLRSSTDLWGLPSLFIKELHQLIFGNTLLQFGVLSYLLLWMQGRFAVLEHPELPNRQRHPQAPSIWLLEALQAIACLPESKLETIQQGYFGAPSPKPTMLLHAHGPQSIRLFGQAFHTRASLPPPLKMGKTQAGTYETFKLKEYPPQLNAMLAQAFHSFSLRADTHLQQPSAGAMEIISKFVVSTFQGEIGPDFANHN